jgi:uncharacterized protein YxeA
MKYLMLIISVIFLISGCAYSVYSNSLPHLKSINISSFENKTDEFELEEDLLDYLVNRYDEDGRLRVVNLMPDCILEGAILDYSRKIDTYDEAGIEEYNVKYLFRLKFTDLTTNEIIWEKDSLILSEVFSENSDSAEFQNEEDAREAIYEKLFADIMKNTLEQW